jgi:hypothetical protein
MASRNALARLPNQIRDNIATSDPRVRQRAAIALTMAARYKNERFDTSSQTAPMTYRLPNLLVIGVQKGGTTWLHSKLSQHPDIFFSKRKELGYFVQREGKRDLAAYAENFAEADGIRYAGEATPSYFWTYDARSKYCGLNRRTGYARQPEEVRDVLGPDVKLILSLRHPVHRAVSAYMHHYKQGRIEPQERLIDLGTRSGIIDMGFYEHHLRRWERVFGPNKIMTVFMDDIRNDADAVLNKIFAYLDVPPIEIANVNQNVHSGFKLTIAGAGLTIDMSDPFTRDLIRRRGLSEVKFPRVRRKDILGLQDLYLDDIEFIEDRFDRRDLGWHVTPSLEDFLSSTARTNQTDSTLQESPAIDF